MNADAQRFLSLLPGLTFAKKQLDDSGDRTECVQPTRALKFSPSPESPVKILILLILNPEIVQNR